VGENGQVFLLRLEKTRQVRGGYWSGFLTETGGKMMSAWGEMVRNFG